MIICSCNSLSDKDIDTAVQGGVCSISQVYASRQCRVKCGQCVPSVACRLKEALRGHHADGSESGAKMSALPHVLTVEMLHAEEVRIKKEITAA